MTKDELLNALACVASNIDDAADSIQDVGAFADFKDDQDEKFWCAYDAIRFELVHLRQTITQIKEQV